jgi:hypothetical protein
MEWSRENINLIGGAEAAGFAGAFSLDPNIPENVELQASSFGDILGMIGKGAQIAGNVAGVANNILGGLRSSGEYSGYSTNDATANARRQRAMANHNMQMHSAGQWGALNSGGQWGV